MEPFFNQASHADDQDTALRVPPRRLAKDDEMDITPMIDITFLLLIYFLVASTPDAHSQVDLPRALHGDAVSQRNATVIIVGEAEGDAAPVFLADRKMASAQVKGDADDQRERITEHVATSLQKDHKTNVVIKANRFVPHREVARVIQAVSAVEGVQIYLAVLETDRT